MTSWHPVVQGLKIEIDSLIWKTAWATGCCPPVVLFLSSSCPPAVLWPLAPSLVLVSSCCPLAAAMLVCSVCPAPCPRVGVSMGQVPSTFLLHRPSRPCSSLVQVCPACQCCPFATADRPGLVTKGSLSYLSSPCFSKNVLQSGVGIVH